MDVMTWLNETEQSGRMVGDGGSVEWSDDDAVKSGSNTEGDVADEPQPQKKDEKKHFRTPITTLNMKSDPISTILDKIDAEISALSRSQSSAATGSTVIQRPSSANRSRSSSQQEEELTRGQLDRSGPMKATQKYDGYSGSSRGRESPLVNGDHRERTSPSFNGTSRGRDSPLFNGDPREKESPGVSTASKGRESPLIHGSHRDRDSPVAHGSPRGRESPMLNTYGDHRGRQSPHLNGDYRTNGAANAYGDNNEDSKQRPQTPDSVSAHNVDEKFKQILRKRTGYSDSKPPAPSDTETVNTEDFNRQFQEALVYSSDESTVDYKSDADESSSESEKTPKGEDSLLWDYFDTVPKSASGFKDDESQSHHRDETGSQLNGQGPESRSIIERLRPKRTRSSPPVYNKQKPTNNHTSQNAPRKPTYVSDAESVRTEDFEFRFKDLIVNQMDSEADLTDTDPLHAKVKEILQITLPYKKNERERSQSENGIRLRDRRKDHLVNGDAPVMSPRENDSRPRERRNEMMNGDVPSPRETINKRRQRESFDLRYHPNSSGESSTRSRDALTRSSTFDDIDSINSASYESKFSRQSSFDGYNQPLSSRSSLSTFSLSGLSRSASQDFSDSTTSSLSSLITSGDGSEFLKQVQYSPLLEKLFEDAESFNLLPKQKPPISSDSKSSRSKDSRCDLILPDDDTEEIPFAKYTFNKKPDGAGSGSPSEMSSSSRSSRDSFDKKSKRNQYMSAKMSTSSYSTGSFASTNFDSSDCTSYLSSVDSTNQKLVKQSSTYYQPFNGSTDSMMCPPAMHHGYSPQPGFPFQSNSLYYPPVAPQPTPDQVLMNLGFGDDIENFLPARFAQDWRAKIMQKQQEMYLKAQQEMLYQANPFLLSRSKQFSKQNSEISGTDHSPETDISSKDSLASLSRASSSSKLPIGHGYKQIPNLISEEKMAAERQSSIEKLRDSLQSDTLISSVNKEKPVKIFQKKEGENGMDLKRKQFARARQKSLPIYLETLNEEDEVSSLKGKLSKAKFFRETTPSNESTKSPSENSTSDHSLSSSNRESIAESNFTDNDINDFKLLALEHDKRLSTEGDSDLSHTVPSIYVEVNPSNESLEIDEILCSHTNSRQDLPVEPAMVSMVLNDADSKHHHLKNQTNHLNPHFLGEGDEKMWRRLSSSSLSISPMPSSPITVIEVGLDNQNDSLDNVTDSIDADDNVPKEVSLSRFSAALDKKINHQTSTESQSQSVDSTNHTSDGASSSMHGKKYVRGQPHSLDKNSTSSEGSKFISEVHHVGSRNSISIEIPQNESQDMCIQADDGSLPPIIRFTDLDSLFDKLVNIEDENLFYMARDFGTQYEPPSEPNMSLDSDKVHCFFNNTPAASSSRRPSVSNQNFQRVHNTFHKEAGIQTDSEENEPNSLSEISTQTEASADKRLKIDSCTNTSSNITRCYCSRVLNRSDSDSSTASDVQLSLQATIDRLEKKTRKYRALYGKKD